MEIQFICRIFQLALLLKKIDVKLRKQVYKEKISVIEKVFMSIPEKKAVFQGYTTVPKKQFLETLADTPYLFRKVRETTNCQCCTEFYFSFS